jgi:hypothetical protein
LCYHIIKTSQLWDRCKLYKNHQPAKPKKKMRVTGSEAVILSLLEEGVDTIFGYPGGAIMPIYDCIVPLPGQDQTSANVDTNRELHMQHKAMPG